jgi:hypothetical protein
MKVAKKVNFTKKPKHKGRKKKAPDTSFNFGANVGKKRRGGFGGGS